MRRFILAVDQNTSATKTILFDEAARVVAKTSLPHKQHYPQPGFVEHDGEEIYSNTIDTMKRCVATSG